MFSIKSRCLKRRQMLNCAEMDGGAWKLEHGALLIEHHPETGGKGLELALPGDWFGVEKLCGLSVNISATALVASRLSPVPHSQLPTNPDLILQLFRQHRRSADHLLALRTGSVTTRIKLLLALMHKARQRALLDWKSEELPTLRHIALLVDAAPETACRALAQLHPALVATASSGFPSGIAMVGD